MSSGVTSRKDMARAASATISTRMELANRLFFRLYQCANMLHKTGTRAVEAEGLTDATVGGARGALQTEGGRRDERR